jgi:hypothetical protein
MTATVVPLKDRLRDFDPLLDLVFSSQQGNLFEISEFQNG